MTLKETNIVRKQNIENFIDKNGKLKEKKTFRKLQIPVYSEQPAKWPVTI